MRLCCLLCLLYLAESGSSQRAIAQEKATTVGWSVGGQLWKGGANFFGVVFFSFSNQSKNQ